MTAEIGLFFLILALLVALVQASYLLPLPKVKPLVLSCLPAAAWLQALCITLAFATLMTLRLDSDFSVGVVAENSNLALPTLYKIAGTWGNHEGSMVLWVWVLAIFGAVMALRAPKEEQTYSLAVAVQSLICAGFLVFILFTSNPFMRIFPPPADGSALNPLLQDVGLSIHPPLLYLGYVGFSIVFSLAIAALIEGRAGSQWAKIAHPWILASWSFLTCGIGLGSWWAYRVLGWGGFWFWDPVENASLLPWLAGTALLHSNIVLKKRDMLAAWVLLLAIVTFALSLLGTFLVRSGVLVSVHSFASDPTRGFFILGYITALVGGALLLFAWRGGTIISHDRPLPLSREGMIIINNLFLLTACGTLLLGTLYPTIVEALGGERLSVGPPYFNITCLPLMAMPLLFAGLAPFMPWQHAPFKRALHQARPAWLATLAAMIILLAWAKSEAVLAMAGFGLAVWLGASSLRWFAKRPTKNIPAVFLSHIGAAVLIAGITGASLWKQETERRIGLGDVISIAGYQLTFDHVSTFDTPNYHATAAAFSVTRDGKATGVLTPEYRFYTIPKSGNGIPAIRSSPLCDLYAVIGQPAPDGKLVTARVYYNPMMEWIWAGCALMALGGVIAIRRSRYAA